jgi:hypothetical protein
LLLLPFSVSAPAGLNYFILIARPDIHGFAEESHLHELIWDETFEVKLISNRHFNSLDVRSWLKVVYLLFVVYPQLIFADWCVLVFHRVHHHPSLSVMLNSLGFYQQVSLSNRPNNFKLDMDLFRVHTEVFCSFAPFHIIFIENASFFLGICPFKGCVEVAIGKDDTNSGFDKVSFVLRHISNQRMLFDTSSPCILLPPNHRVCQSFLGRNNFI